MLPYVSLNLPKFPLPDFVVPQSVDIATHDPKSILPDSYFEAFKNLDLSVGKVLTFVSTEHLQHRPIHVDGPTVDTLAFGISLFYGIPQTFQWYSFKSLPQYRVHQSLGTKSFQVSPDVVDPSYSVTSPPTPVLVHTSIPHRVMSNTVGWRAHVSIRFKPRFESWASVLHKFSSLIV